MEVPRREARLTREKIPRKSKDQRMPPGTAMSRVCPSDFEQQQSGTGNLPTNRTAVAPVRSLLAEALRVSEFRRGAPVARLSYTVNGHARRAFLFLTREEDLLTSHQSLPYQPRPAPAPASGYPAQFHLDDGGRLRQIWSPGVRGQRRNAATSIGRRRLSTQTWYQAETGRIPISGAGYGGKFAGPGFEGIWLDMSEIVRPTRDGIHGRESDLHPGRSGRWT